MAVNGENFSVRLKSVAACIYIHWLYGPICKTASYLVVSLFCIKNRNLRLRNAEWTAETVEYFRYWFLKCLMWLLYYSSCVSSLTFHHFIKTPFITDGHNTWKIWWSGSQLAHEAAVNNVLKDFLKKGNSTNWKDDCSRNQNFSSRTLEKGPLAHVVYLKETVAPYVANRKGWLHPSDSKQCCYCTFDLTNKTCLLPKMATKLRLPKLV